MSMESKHRILVVDDEPAVREVLSRCLTEAGYACETVDSAEKALAILKLRPVSLLISDIRMPEMSGIELLRRIRQSFGDVAVIMCTGLSDQDMASEAVELGAYGYIVKPFRPSDVLINVINALERRRLDLASVNYRQELEAKILERTKELRQREQEIVWRLLSAVRCRHDETGAHIRRIGLFSAVLARECGWSPEQVDEIRLAGMMHDIGKIGISDQLLLKKGRLTPSELKEIRSHTVLGARILAGSSVPLLQMAEEIALSHHEWWDGTGYPRGKAGDRIPESARIVAIADVYDALTQRRVYKPALPENEALKIMTEERSRHFDPEIFEQFLKALPEFREINRTFRDEDSLDYPGAESGFGLLQSSSPTPYVS